MTREQLEAIRKATEVLPKRFCSGEFWDGEHYCFWGWVLKKVGRDPAKEQSGTQQSHWEWIRASLMPEFSMTITNVADDAINQYGDPVKVREVVLADLETRVREVALG